MIVITGPTATGKTRLAALLAYKINGEIISADSRQVFRGMDIGTGKDLCDYKINGGIIPYHLIDIAEAGTEFSVFQFAKYFKESYKNITERKKPVILCGGTGLYIQAAISGFDFPEVPKDETFRKFASNQSMEELTNLLTSYRSLHNTSDITDRERLTRAVEIERFKKKFASSKSENSIPHIIFGVQVPRDIIRRRISKRLDQRLQEGMIDEVKALLAMDISPERLDYYGLEYRYISQYLCNGISYNEMYRKLEIAIHQFAKRQMTWFRRMEKQGHCIHWIDGLKNEDDKLDEIHQILATHSLNILEKIES
ncbi:MAG: tRNA (adenosine(37)-N6)-dimethylallyltransferase MiaA [Bacteroidales bacterium]|nr:tRNA (adenosine(37)-N6)-dimethylallyltransferase MiaA [Bacteroidales bacterium]